MTVDERFERNLPTVLDRPLSRADARLPGRPPVADRAHVGSGPPGATRKVASHG